VENSYIERGIRFLEEVGLLQKQMKCPKCQRSMNLSQYEAGTDKFRWNCGKKGTEGRYQTSRSISHSSWFTNSKLIFLEVMLLTYDVLNKVAVKSLKKEYKLGDHAICDWTKFCREVILECVQTPKKSAEKER
jgi:ribosomal protein S27AE